jgi:hypothetical protein
LHRGKPKGKRPLAKPMQRLKNNTKKDFLKGEADA